MNYETTVCIQLDVFECDVIKNVHIRNPSLDPHSDLDKKQ